MKIFISADIEGVAGIVHGQQGTPGNAEYETGRRLMIAEVNAAIAGAFAGGASEVLVNDSHYLMRNLVPGELDPRVELVSGHLKPASMAQGLDDSFAGMMLVGYHVRAGARGILAHTMSGYAFASVTVNGHAAGEALLYGAYAGAMGVPVILATGDDQLRLEIAAHFPGAEYAQVKVAYGAQAGRSLSPSAARALIEAAAARALRRATTIAPLILEPPFRCEVRLNTQSMADLIDLLPMCERRGAVGVAFESPTTGELIRVLIVMATLVESLR
jgi:D-amino peptidase